MDSQYDAAGGAPATDGIWDDAHNKQPTPQTTSPEASLEPTTPHHSNHATPPSRHHPGPETIRGALDLQFQSPPGLTSLSDPSSVPTLPPQYDGHPYHAAYEQQNWASISRSPFGQTRPFGIGPQYAGSDAYAHAFNGHFTGDVYFTTPQAPLVPVWPSFQNSDSPSSYQPSGPAASLPPSGAWSPPFHHHYLPHFPYGHAVPSPNPSPDFGHSLHPLGSSLLNTPTGSQVPAQRPGIENQLSADQQVMGHQIPYFSKLPEGHPDLQTYKLQQVDAGTPKARAKTGRVKRGRPNRRPRATPGFPKMKGPATSGGSLEVLPEDVMRRILGFMSIPTYASFRRVSKFTKNAVDTHPWNQLLEWIVASDLKALKMMVDTGVAYYFTIYSLEVFVQWKCTTCIELGQNLFLPRMCRVCHWCLETHDEYEVLVRTTASNKYRLSDKLIRAVPTVVLKPPVSVENRLIQTVHIVSDVNAHQMGIKVHGSEEKMLEKARASDKKKLQTYLLRLKEWEANNLLLAAAKDEPRKRSRASRAKPVGIPEVIPLVNTDNLGVLLAPSNTKSRRAPAGQRREQSLVKNEDAENLDEPEDDTEDEQSPETGRKRARRNRSTKPRQPKTSDMLPGDKSDKNYRQKVSAEINFVDGATGKVERAIQCKDCCEKASGVPDSDQKCLTRCYLESTYRNEHIITCASSVE